MMPHEESHMAMPPLSPEHFDDAPPYLWQKAIALLTFFLALGLYVLTLAPTVATIFDDSLEFQLVTYLLGIAHPTGYPLYTLLGWLFTRLPVGDVAFRVNLMSAVFGALTIAFVYLVGLELIASGGIRKSHAPETQTRRRARSLSPTHLRLAANAGTCQSRRQKGSTQWPISRKMSMEMTSSLAQFSKRLVPSRGWEQMPVGNKMKCALRKEPSLRALLAHRRTGSLKLTPRIF